MQQDVRKLFNFKDFRAPERVYTNDLGGIHNDSFLVGTVYRLRFDCPVI